MAEIRNNQPSTRVSVIDGNFCFVQEIRTTEVRELSSELYQQRLDSVLSNLGIWVKARYEHCQAMFEKAVSDGQEIYVSGKGEDQTAIWKGGRFSYRSYERMQKFVRTYNPENPIFYEPDKNWSEVDPDFVGSLVLRQQAFAWAIKALNHGLVATLPNGFNNWTELNDFLVDELFQY